MPTISDIHAMILDTSAALTSLDKAIASDPGSVSLQLTRDSLRKRFGDLEAHFLELASESGADAPGGPVRPRRHSR